MWALDLGTTNSLLARWDVADDRPAVLEMPAVAHRPAKTDAVDVSRAVPSAVHVLDHPSWTARLARSGFLARHFFLGKLALIGREAVELNQLRHRPNFAATFKRQLAQGPLMTVARAGGRACTARDAAWLFVRELFAQAKAVTGERIRGLVVTAPVEAFETYRAEVSAICRRLGVREVRFLDEPVAAALGYGIGLSRDRHVLVVDFGGGTMHMVVVRLGASEAQAGRAEVVAKAGRDIGGNLVDRWLLQEFCRRLDFDPGELLEGESRLWTGLMLGEACRVKEAVYFDERATFELTPPESLRRLEERMRGQPTSLELDRAGLVELLDRFGLYRALAECLDEAVGEAAGKGVPRDAIEDVLMVGGSTLLPNVYAVFEERFGRGRVRAWQPFEAVVHGGAVFAAGRVVPSDFIVHDYALLTYGLRTKEPEYSVIVPRGTTFPTKPDFWKGRLVPTCALGEPEREFKLVVCEIGSGQGGNRLVWDGEGRLHALGQANPERVVVKLNESDPALGTLDPPHSPRDKAPRLEVAFGVNAERWLCATVYDLRTRRHLMRGEPVVRLL